jgi:predicted amidohydrolase YtcJ|tara:strand:- start:2073 stop:3812 length:1740 start_codon:yes stop_codon:yes gene_type:complete
VKGINKSILLLFGLIITGCSQNEGTQLGADMILTNARVYTMRWDEPDSNGTLSSKAPNNEGWRPDANAVVIQNSKIKFVGQTTKALSYKGEKTQIIDLAGATVLPGLVDSHTHVFGVGAALERVDLIGVSTEEEMVARVVERAKITPKGDWIIGRGWDEGVWANRYPDKELLTKFVPDHPVFLSSLHSFGGLVNQKALDVVGINSSTKVPVGGEIRLGINGEPNGLFLNRAVPLVRDAIPPPSQEAMMIRALAGLNQMAEDGFVAVHDAGLDSSMMAALEELEAQNLLPIRVYGMLSLRDESLMEKWINKGPDEDLDSMLVTRSVKAYYDGALGSRGARLLNDYSDLPGHRGISGDGYGFNEILMTRAMNKGFQVAIHAIGDAGNREVLDILERVFDESPSTKSNRHRIEHAQILHPDDLPRLGQLGIIASMEPQHAVEDKTWAETRLGLERIKGAYAWRSLRQNKAHLTFNSDNPGSDHNIFYGLHSAITRQDKYSLPEGGWYIEEAVNVDEAIRAYTSWSAYASFKEDVTGIIAVGRWADLSIMNVDPFLISDDSPVDLLDGQILMTIVNGSIVYER